MSRTALVITAAVVLAGLGCGGREVGGTPSAGSGGNSGTTGGAATGTSSGSTSGTGSAVATGTASGGGAGSTGGSSTGAARGATGSTTGSHSGAGSVSGQGSSCLRVTDCAPGFVCLANVCSDNLAASGASTGTGGGSGTGMDSGSGSSTRTGCNLIASASVAGTLLGNALTARDAFTIQTGSRMPSVAVVDYSNACLLNPVQSVKASSKILFLLFTSTGPLGTGVFTAPNTVTAQYAVYDQACMATGESATGGSVHVTQANACGATGTFDLVLNSDHVTGSFVAPTCNPVGTDGGECL